MTARDAQRYFDQGLRLAYAFNHNEALRAFPKAQELDPLSPSINTAAARIFYYARQYDRALADFAQALIVNPSSPTA